MLRLAILLQPACLFLTLAAVPSNAVSQAVSTALSPDERVLEKYWLQHGTVDVFQADDSTQVDILPECYYWQMPENPKPPHGRKTRVTVVMRVLVDADGLVKQAEIKTSSQQPQYDSSAMMAALLCRYKPAVRDCQPIAKWIAYKVEFNHVEVRPLPRRQGSISFDIIHQLQPDEATVENGPYCIFQTPQTYPPQALEQGLHGQTRLRVLIGEDGFVKQSELVTSSGHASLDSSAIRAAYWNRFKPAVKDCRPVAVWVTYNVYF